jgi:alkylation response protein AidB-like acyl-CoA dehydrogenase
VDFELSSEQAALRDAASALLDELASPAKVRAVVDTGGTSDPVLWTAMVDQGWTAVTVPEPAGGLGLGMVEAAVLLEQVGAHVAPAPILSQIVALECLVGGPGERWVEPLLRGEAVAAVAGGAVSADPVGRGDWVVTGETEPVPYAPEADVVLVPADHGLFAVELPADRRPERLPAMDRTRPVGRIRLEATPALRLGGEEAVQRYRDVAATALSAELLGIAARSLEMAVAYASVREQFGRPIGSFQAVKHRCADMLVDVEGMRSAAYWAAWCVQADDADRSVAASTAKTWCSDAARRVTASALQVHGGIGFTWECDVHLYLKRAQLDEVAFGDAAFHRARLASLLRARVEAGESVI